MKAVRTVIDSNWVSYLQIRSVGSHCTSGREKERKKRTGLGQFYFGIHRWFIARYVHTYK